ncbi:hypothetical protein EXIGLDRAFT_272861 [Exidia glandulosa HHB12029]|uniref:Uncharacterized protein n=1 Tax=Exidia glandulosa HHB12029 TaxID=1314781 RepID=A0A165DKV9_EXIGL|nr:hypothetical protein EXIGLDRAFT_272861 [Exidia glandulosa HHB12029]
MQAQRQARACARRTAKNGPYRTAFRDYTTLLRPPTALEQRIDRARPAYLWRVQRLDLTWKASQEGSGREFYSVPARSSHSPSVTLIVAVHDPRKQSADLSPHPSRSVASVIPRLSSSKGRSERSLHCRCCSRNQQLAAVASHTSLAHIRDPLHLLCRRYGAHSPVPAWPLRRCHALSRLRAPRCRSLLRPCLPQSRSLPGLLRLRLPRNPSISSAHRYFDDANFPRARAGQARVGCVSPWELA